MMILLMVFLLPLVYSDECNIDNTDMWWGDIGNYKASSFLECKAACRVNSACQAVVYYKSGGDRGRCWLKNGSYGSPGRNTGCIAAKKPCITMEGPCPAGQYKTSRTSCGTCGRNQYSRAGSQICTRCPLGTISEPGSDNCTPCGKGRFRNNIMDNCMDCKVGSYNDLESASTCKACPRDGDLSAGAVAPADCTYIIRPECPYELIQPAQTLEQAKRACKKDGTCLAVACHMTIEDHCMVARSMETGQNWKNAFMK